MERKVSLMENLNNLGLGIYVLTVGSIGYLIARGLKKLLDIVLEALLQKYIQFIRNEVEVYYDKMMTDISDKFIDRFEEFDKKIDKIERHETKSHATQNQLLKDLLGGKDG